MLCCFGSHWDGAGVGASAREGVGAIKKARVGVSEVGGASIRGVDGFAITNRGEDSLAAIGDGVCGSSIFSYLS